MAPIVLISAATPSHDEAARLCWPLWERYCQKHGYHWQPGTLKGGNKEAKLAKLRHLAKAITPEATAVWVDADSFPTHDATPLHTVLDDSAAITCPVDDPCPHAANFVGSLIAATFASRDVIAAAAKDELALTTPAPQQVALCRALGLNIRGWKLTKPINWKDAPIKLGQLSEAWCVTPKTKLPSGTKIEVWHCTRMPSQKAAVIRRWLMQGRDQAERWTTWTDAIRRL